MGTINNRTWVGLLALAIFAMCFYSLRTIMIPFIGGIIGAYAFNRAVTKMEQYRINRGLGSALIVLTLILVLTLLVVFVFPTLQKQLIQLAFSIPRLADTLFAKMSPLLKNLAEQTGTEHDLENLKAQLTHNVGDILRWVITVLSNILSNSVAVANILSLVVLTPIVMYYLLKDWPKMVHQIDSLLPKKYAPSIRQYASEVNKTLSDYAKGQGLVCLTLMILYASALSIYGLKKGILVGFLTGFLAFIPYVGAFIGYTLAMSLAFSQYDSWQPFLSLTLIFISVASIESYVLTPRFVGRSIGLSPAWIIFSLLAFATWFGFIGVVLALPLAALSCALVKIGVTWYKQTQFYNQRLEKNVSA